ncbi:MAG: phosphate ABC transporter permease PstA [Desulfovibrionaceae bacterium]
MDPANADKRRRTQTIMFGLFRAATGINGLALALICCYILVLGLPAISWEFLTAKTPPSLTEGGIMPCILGTIFLSYGALLIALPWGVSTAIYLNEYAKPGPFLHVIRLAINNLAGVPSVVFGLFGLAFFAIILKMGVSLLAGMCTLAALILPMIIGASEEALRAVPQTYREASLGLGGTKWQTISRVVLPAAAPGILTGAILGVSRAAGETAAIMFTAAVMYTGKLPGNLFDDVMALPYHIYVLATAGTNIDKTVPMQFGTTLVLIVLVLGMNLLAIILRARLGKKLR